MVPETIQDILGIIRDLLNSAIPFIVGLTIFVIIWGIFQYVVHGAEEEKRAEGRQFVLWGIIGVFMMLSVWGLVNVLVNTFELDDDIDPDTIPKVPELKVN